MFCHFNLGWQLGVRVQVGKQWQCNGIPHHCRSALKNSWSQPACSSAAAIQVWAEWADSTTSSATGSGRKLARVNKRAAGVESSDVEFGILEDDRDTGRFQECYLLHELLIACRHSPPRQPAYHSGPVRSASCRLSEL